MGKLLNFKGTTLIELLISVGLFGVVALGISSLYIESSKRALDLENNAKLSEEMLVFANSLEILLTNTTAIFNCNCQDDCVFDILSPPLPTSSPGSPAIIFEIENAYNPAQKATDGCYYHKTKEVTSGGHDLNSIDDLIPRGCKQTLKIEFTAPSAESINDPIVDATGKLEIFDFNNDAQAIFSLEGIESFICGMPKGEQRKATSSYLTNYFHYEIKIKRAGVRRQITANIPFRNFNSQGIHFGKIKSLLNCVSAGESSDIGNCCSGYGKLNSDGGLDCISADDCLKPTAVGVTSDHRTLCCSHEVGTDLDGNTRCL